MSRIETLLATPTDQQNNGFAEQEFIPSRRIQRHRCTVRVLNPKVDVTNKTFEEIRDECRRKEILFEDPEFPANHEALYFKKRTNCKIEWKRPHEIASDPQLFVDGPSRFDIKQGKLGDCWLLAAVACLSLNDELLHRIIPDDQGFDNEEYAGVFHFQFWQYGEWVEVVIDDLLPTSNGQLVYLHSAKPNEFWSALLEKAYAKLHGSFESLNGGDILEAMEDFTGGVTEHYDLKDPPKNLYHLMGRSLHKGSLMGSAIESQNNENVKLPNGLMKGHAYSVTGLYQIRTGVELVRVRNPWGRVEWNGDWSDSSPKWNEVPEEKKMLDVEFEEDGEFWISFHDFCWFFTKLQICNLQPDALEDDDTSSQWITSWHKGRWVRGCSAGGCPEHKDTFWINPQFRLRLEEEDDDPNDDEKGCSFIISLTQMYKRKQKAKGQKLQTIGLVLYKLKDKISSDKRIKKDYFLHNLSVAKVKFTNLREISRRLKLPPGEYVIVPSTYKPDDEADFILRIFTEKRSKVNKLDEKTERMSVGPDGVVNPEDFENEQEFQALFNQLSGETREIDAFILKENIYALMKKNENDGQTCSGFGLEACRSMVALMDVTNSGRLNFEEFKSLWILVRKWIDIFKKFDKDNSYNFDSYELRDALRFAGFSLSSSLYQKLCIRYANKDLKITINDFILLTVRLEAMFKAYNEFKDPSTLSMDDWLTKTMYS